MEKLEFEIKFFLSDIQSLRQDILDLGARSQGRFFEKNLRFEDANKTLKSKKCLLRLRHDHKTTLTFKSPPPESSNQFKVLKEQEVEVGDFATMNDILESLGFHCEQIIDLDVQNYLHLIEADGHRD